MFNKDVIKFFYILLKLEIWKSAIIGNRMVLMESLK